MRKVSHFQVVIGDECTIVCHYMGGVLKERLVVRSIQKGHTEKLLKIIQEHPNSGMNIYVDTEAQKYTTHKFSNISFLHLNGAVSTKLNSEFNREYLKLSYFLNKTSAAKKENVYMLAGMRMSKNVRTWIDYLHSLPIIVKGIYMMPIQLYYLVDRLKPRDARKGPRLPQLDVVVTNNKSGGVRIAAFFNKKLISTRLLTTVRHPDPEITAGSIEQEVVDVVDQLGRKNILSDGTYETNAYLVLEPAVYESFKGEYLKEKSITAHPYIPYDVTTALGHPEAGKKKDAFSDPVVLTAIMKKSGSRYRLHTPATRRTHNIVTAIRGMRLLLSIGAIAMICAISKYAYDITLAYDNLEKKHEMSDALKSEISELSHLNIGEKDDQIHVTEKIYEIVDLHKTWEQQMNNPLVAINSLPSIINDYTAIRSVKWSFAQNISFLGDDEKQKKSRSKEQPSQPISNMDLRVIMVAEGGDPKNLISQHSLYSSMVKEKFDTYKIDISKLPFTFGFDEEKTDDEIMITIKMVEYRDKQQRDEEVSGSSKYKGVL